jgi:hypothetical protein
MGVVGYHRERTPQGCGDTSVYYNEDSRALVLQNIYENQLHELS